MRSKGTGSDDPGRAGSGSEGRRGRFGRRAPERTTPGTDNDPWADDQWDDGWSDRTPPGRGTAGPGPQQVDAWLESDPDGGEITRDIAQRWTGAEVPPPGGTWTDDPADTWDADDEPTDEHRAPMPDRAPVASFESLDDDEPELAPADDPRSEPAPVPPPATPTSLFAAPTDEPTVPAAPPVRRGARAQDRGTDATGPVFDPHPFVEADTAAAETPPARRRTEAAVRPSASTTDDVPGDPTWNPHPHAGTGLSDAARRSARTLGTACVAIVAIRVLLSLAAAAGTIEGGVFLDRIATLSGMHGAAYAVALVLGVWLLAASRSDDDADAPAVALGVALTSAVVMLVGAVLSARLDFRALDAINEAGGDASLARLAQVGADAVGPVGLSIVAAWAALRATAER